MFITGTLIVVGIIVAIIALGALFGGGTRPRFRACPQCGASTVLGANHCQTCGARLT